MTCPELLSLSQLADGELPASEAASLEGHVAGCASCETRLARLQRALEAASTQARTARSARPETARAPDCLSPTELARWLDAGAPASARAAATRHVERCNACLEDALAAHRLMARLARTPHASVPAALQARVAAQWPIPAPTELLSRVVVRVTRTGAELLERHLIAPLRELVELGQPLPAMRSEAGSRELRFRLEAAAATVEISVMPTGDQVGLLLTIASDAGEVLADQRVFLRRHGRSIYSARTDGAGILRLPALERAVYEVACPGIATAFRLDLRSS